MRPLEDALLLLAEQDSAVDAAELIDRIEDDLSEESVPVVAWDGRRTMQTEELPTTIRQGRSKRRAWAFAAALTAVVMAIGIPAWLLAGAEPGSVVSEPEPVFAWGDDLSQWVTDAEMRSALRHVAERYDGEPFRGDVVLSDSDGTDWEWLAGGWRVLVHNGDHGGRFVGPPENTDWRLPDGVTYEAEDGFGWGHYILSGPNSNEMIAIFLIPPGRSYGYPGTTEVDDYKDMMFAFAAEMLRELGWVD